MISERCPPLTANTVLDLHHVDGGTLRPLILRIPTFLLAVTFLLQGLQDDQSIIQARREPAVAYPERGMGP